MERMNNGVLIYRQNFSALENAFMGVVMTIFNIINKLKERLFQENLQNYSTRSYETNKLHPCLSHNILWNEVQIKPCVQYVC